MEGKLQEILRLSRGKKTGSQNHRIVQVGRDSEASSHKKLRLYREGCVEKNQEMTPKMSVCVLVFKESVGQRLHG